MHFFSFSSVCHGVLLCGLWASTALAGAADTCPSASLPRVQLQVYEMAPQPPRPLDWATSLAEYPQTPLTLAAPAVIEPVLAQLPAAQFDQWFSQLPATPRPAGAALLLTDEQAPAEYSVRQQLRFVHDIAATRANTPVPPMVQVQAETLYLTVRLTHGNQLSVQWRELLGWANQVLTPYESLLIHRSHREITHRTPILQENRADGCLAIPPEHVLILAGISARQGSEDAAYREYLLVLRPPAN